MAYTNGRLPDSALALIPGTSRRIRADLLDQVVAFRAAFATRFGVGLVVTDGYRPDSEQERIFRERYTTTHLVGRPYKTWLGVRWYQRPGTAMAAVPGASNHGLGTALDLGSRVNVGGSDEHRWAVENAPRFGLRWPAEWARAAREWWHFEATGVVPVSSYIAIPGAVPTAPTVTPPTPLIPTVQEDDMLSLILWCYRNLMGREPVTDEVISWLGWTTGKTPTQVVEMFLASAAEPGSVTRAYQDHLGRTADPSEIASWLSAKPTVRNIRARVADSAEAKSRKA